MFFNNFQQNLSHMQVNKEQTGEVSASIEIRIGKNDYEPEVNKALKDYQRKAVVPGFRQGKVPFGIVKKMYGNAMLAEQVNKLVSDSLNNYIKDNDLRILGYPLSDVERTGTIDFDSNDEFSFYFNVAIAPELDIKLEEIQVTYPKVKADPIEIQKTIDKLLTDYPEVTYPETYQQGDALELRSTQVDDKGNEVEGGFQATVMVDSAEIASDAVRQKLEGQVLGAELILNYSEVFGDDEKVIKALKLSDEDNHLIHADFNVVIDEIKRTEPATLNESFFGRIFPSETIDSEDEFRNRIGQEIEKQLESQSDYFVYSLGLKQLVDETPMKFDEAFMKRWIVDNSNGEISASEIENTYGDFEKSMRYQLIEDELSSKYPELLVKKEEVRQYVANYFFGQMQMEITEDMEKMLSSTIDSILKNKKEEDKIIRQLRENKMVRLFRSKLNLVEQEMTAEEFKSLVTKNSMEITEE